MGQPKTGRGQTIPGLARNDQLAVKQRRAGQSGSAPTAIIVVVVVVVVVVYGYFNLEGRTGLSSQSLRLTVVLILMFLHMCAEVLKKFMFPRCPQCKT